MCRENELNVLRERYDVCRKERERLEKEVTVVGRNDD